MKTSNFQFESPVLEELVFAVNPKFKASNENIEMKNAFHTDVKRVENQRVAKVSLTLTINETEEDVPFNLRIRLSALFRWNDSLSDEAVDAMLKINASALLLSYMRPIVSNVTNYSRFPSYNLPFVNFVDG